MTLEAEVTLFSDSQFFAGLSGDISEGGIFVSTYRDLPIGHAVSVAFTLPNGQAMARGTVRWVRRATESLPPGIGIGFEGLTADDERLIRDFCKERPPLYYDPDIVRSSVA